MPRSLFSTRFVKSTSLPATTLLVSFLLLSPVLYAQRPVAHPVVAPGRGSPPRPVFAPTSRPAVAGPRFSPAHAPRTGSESGLAEGFAGRGIFVLRHPFFRPRPFPLWGEWWFASFSWVTCGPFWGWEPDCGVPPAAAYGSAPFAPPQPYQPVVYVYGYGQARGELIELYLKDGSAFSVTDYWFLNNDVHFTVPEEGPGKPGEQIIPLDELDLQRTIEVNTRRGFRLVMRNEPWQQYLRDHPDVTPPPLAVPPAN